MNNYKEIAQKIKNADAILIGASNGLSITEGIHLFANNQAMRDLFSDLQQKYGLQNLLQGMMGRWRSYEELWGFWSRMVNHYSGSYKSSPVMDDLKSIVGNKDYFIITSNGEKHFELAGFDESKIFEIEGTWLDLCCSKFCCDNSNDNFDGFDIIKNLAKHENDGLVPTELLPRCPHCGSVMVPTMAAGVIKQDAQNRYKAFLEKYTNKNIVILELGIGAKNTLIKAPLMQITKNETNATYVTFNLSELYIAPEIVNKSFAVEGFLDETLTELKKCLN